MEKYKTEYLELKNRLVQLKKEIQELLEKYDKDENGDYLQPYQKNKIMEVLGELYEERKGTWYQGAGVLDNYDDGCGVPIEELEKLVELFTERKITKRRLGLIKGLIIRKFIYY